MFRPFQDRPTSPPLPAHKCPEWAAAFNDFLVALQERDQALQQATIVEKRYYTLLARVRALLDAPEHREFRVEKNDA